MLHISIEGKGSVGVKLMGNSQYTANPLFQLTAKPENVWEFERWKGDLEGDENPVLLEINEVKQVTAIFQFNGVVDFDGNEYRTVIIGEQEWMAENLRVTRYRNGSLIPTGLTNDDWGWPVSSAYAIYPNERIDGLESDEKVVEAYGMLYNWYAVVDSRGLCPLGWNVPTDDDWEQLTGYLHENHDNIGNKLKSRLQVDSPLGEPWNTDEHPRWNTDDEQYGTDDFGFSALPGGYRRYDGEYLNAGDRGYWWSSTVIDYKSAWERILDTGFGYVQRGDSNKRNGFSVRCIRDKTDDIIAE